MSNWGQILVLGTCPHQLKTYLTKTRLEFVVQPIGTPMEEHTHYLLAFLCGEPFQEQLVESHAYALSELKIPTIILGANPAGELATKCESLWYSSYVSLPGTNDVFQQVLNKALYEPKAKLHQVEMEDYATRLGSLSSRQRLILQMAADGVTNRRIARLVGLAEKSVERERRNARRLINAKNSAEMMRVVTLGAIFEYGNPGLSSGQTTA